MDSIIDHAKLYIIPLFTSEQTQRLVHRHRVSISAAVTLITTYALYTSITTVPRKLAHIPHLGFFEYMKAMMDRKSIDEVSKELTIPTGNKSDSGLYVVSILTPLIHFSSQRFTYSNHSALTEMDGLFMSFAQKLQRSSYLKQVKQLYSTAKSVSTTQLLALKRHISKGGSITYIWYIIWPYAWHTSYWQSYWSSMESSPKGKYDSWIHIPDSPFLASRLPTLLFMEQCQSRCLANLEPNFSVLWMISAKRVLLIFTI